jgi:hypothetical protein
VRQVINVTEASDADAVAADALRRIPPAALDTLQREALTSQLRTALASLVEQGKRLAAQGSQMRAERSIEVGGVQVLIRFTAGIQPSFWERLRRALGVS